MRRKRHKISVRCGGVDVETIQRVLKWEMIGNFCPAFCRYQGKDWLVCSKGGDLSDIYRRKTYYLDKLYIDLDREVR